MRRRAFLAGVGAGTLVTLAGCTSDDHDVPPPTGTLVVTSDGVATTRTVEVFVVDLERGEAVLDEAVSLGGGTQTYRWSLGTGSFNVQVSTGERRLTRAWAVTDSARRLTVSVGESDLTVVEGGSV